MKRIFLLASLLITLGAQAQKASKKSRSAATTGQTDRRITFQPGQKLEMVSEVNGSIAQEMGGQSMDMKMTGKVIRSYDVESVTDTAARLEHKVKRVQFSFEGMGQAQSFDSENEADLKSDLGKSVEKGLKNKYSVQVDGLGTVRSVQSDDDNPNTAGAPGADPMGNMLSQFAGAMELPKPGDRTPFQVLPARGALVKGFTWTDSLKREEQGLATYTVADITDNEILIDFTEDGRTEKTQEASGVEIKVSMKTRSTGRITLDRKSGLLKEKTSTSEGNGFVEAMGQNIPMQTKFTAVTRVNR
ncbi:MAG TPA: DUF6263 family protein [Chitinophagaceae bacterium]|nr:DUF6263 family protein [Chitinophagaceae bacterium]